MKFGDVLKETRDIHSLSVKKLADLSNVSTAYISKLENGKRNFPSEKYIFNLLMGIKSHLTSMTNKFNNVDDVKEIVEEETKQTLRDFISADDSTIDIKKFDDILNRFQIFYDEQLQKRIEDNSIIKNKIFNNEIALYKNTVKVETLDKPYFDLNWILEQNEYEVFYGRSYVFNSSFDKKFALNEQDMFYYNALSSHDIKTIKKLIEVYLDSKYRKFNNPNELFNILSREENSGYFDIDMWTEFLFKESRKSEKED